MLNLRQFNALQGQSQGVNEESGHKIKWKESNLLNAVFRSKPAVGVITAYARSMIEEDENEHFYLHRPETRFLSRSNGLAVKRGSVAR